MKTFLKILLLFSASTCALAVCQNTCDESGSCREVYNCLKNACFPLTEEDLPAKCKCYVKCNEEFSDIALRSTNCLLKGRLQNCLKDGNCETKNVSELQNMDQDCKCTPGVCNLKPCIRQLLCLTESNNGSCQSTEALQKEVKNPTKFNSWNLPEKCNCFSKCAHQAVGFLLSCRRKELLRKCWLDNDCKNESKRITVTECRCEFGCSSQLKTARAATDSEAKCLARKDYIKCASSLGCADYPALIKNIECPNPTNGSPSIGSHLLLVAFLVTTILAAFVTTNIFMA